ncbi:MAG: hypothetical protein JNL28_12130 [Planctomycetes bacterium]|nr:hypothetical protein [Planctomycetota bacterium]
MIRLICLLLCLCTLACGRTPKGDRRAFLIAAEAGDAFTVGQELDNGVMPDDVFQIGDRPALFLAAINGHPQVVKLLLERGADVHHQHKGASLKMEVLAQWGHVRDAHAKPDSASTYKKVDGTVVPMKDLKLDNLDYERVIKLIDTALAVPSAR